MNLKIDDIMDIYPYLSSEAKTNIDSLSIDDLDTIFSSMDEIQPEGWTIPQINDFFGIEFEETKEVFDIE